MPAVREQFKSYHAFASASLTDIYGDRLNKAMRLSANDLESGVWINESKQDGVKLHWRPLPWDAQLSPVNDIVSGDFNGDGKMEIILAQNHYTNWIETGRWRGNPGGHMEWRQNGFAVIPHRQSGIMLPGDIKALLTLDPDGHGVMNILGASNNGALLQFKAKPRSQ